jgi:hypothetical protein
MLQKAFKHDGPAAGWGAQAASLLVSAASRNEPDRERVTWKSVQFIADKTNRLLDFGWCLLGLNAAPSKDAEIRGALSMYNEVYPAFDPKPPVLACSCSKLS